VSFTGTDARTLGQNEMCEIWNQWPNWLPTTVLLGTKAEEGRWARVQPLRLRLRAQN
jgi:hypothetical protein